MWTRRVRSFSNLQAKLGYLFNYAGRKQLLVNAMKTYLMIFNSLPTRPLTLYLGDTQLTYVREVTYVGVPLASDKANICVPLYKVTRDKANRAAWAITGADSVLKGMPPAAARLLYTARVDALLTAAADIVPDMDRNIEMLEKVQVSFLQRILGLSSQSMKLPLFTELGLMPLRY
ncbi:unnamed protein product [Peniophora sp. CBMAI 1063]|nr:unnamed protein product [Peniophora sp. CBMAI 1063]